MHEERRMYELEYPAPAVSHNDHGDKGTTLVVALHGYADAGLAVEASADHLKAALESRPLATFNSDELIDYRSRRPAVTIDSDSAIDIESLDLDIRVVRDTSGNSFLLLSGPEPDLRWEAFTNAVADLVDRFEVDNTICLYAAPMPVPHTRPLVVTAHGTSASLVSRLMRMENKLMVPGSASLYLEKELSKRERNVAGFTAHVPHYLASSPYPHATHRLLESISAAAGLNLPLKVIEADIDKVDAQLSEQVNSSEEISEVVHHLEEQYDAYMERYRSENPQAIMPGEVNAPSGEEIGEEFQRFLAGLSSSPSSYEQLLNADIDDLEDGNGREAGKEGDGYGDIDDDF